jgi:hypothetical protein
MAKTEDFETVFIRLKDLLAPYAHYLTVKTDSPGVYYLEGPFSPKYKRELFFGSAQIKKNYVSFYLMPVYMYPDLLAGISDRLKKRMQGKSCFNFKSIDEAALAELGNLTLRGFERFRAEEMD